MATTYKDYYINYNGTRISNNEDTGLTAVNIYYNGTYLGEGAHTLNCAGQYMNGNVTIGARTLNCGGQYMSGNVQVLTGARYRWYKYYAGLAYSYNTSSSTFRIAGPDRVWTTRVANPNCGGCYITHKSYGWSFNSSNGNFTMNNPEWYALDYSEGTMTAILSHNKIMMHNANSASGTTMYLWEYVEGSQAGSGIADWRYLNGQGLSTQFWNPGQADYTMTTYTSYGYYYQGGYIGVVSDTNPSAYPNGTTWDGQYWYVAI